MAEMQGFRVTSAWRARGRLNIALLALAVTAPTVLAADALRGRDVYLNAALVKQRPGLKSCVQCHGLPPERKLWGASAEQLRGTIGAVAAMAAFANELDATDLGDLAAFLAQPLALPLPQPRIAPLQPRVAAQPGSTSPTLALSLENGGTGPFVLGATPLRFVGGAAPDFWLDRGSCVPAATLAPGASCSFQLRFAPGAGVPVGSRATTELRIEYQNIALPTVVQVESAAAAVAALSLSAPGLGFEAPALRAAAPAQTLVLSNGGQANLSLQAPRLAGAAADDYSVTGACTQASMLAPGAQCQLQVVFRPSAAGIRSAQLQVSWDGGMSGVALTGTSGVSTGPAPAQPPTGAPGLGSSAGGGGTVGVALAVLLFMGAGRRRRA